MFRNGLIVSCYTIFTNTKVHYPNLALWLSLCGNWQPEETPKDYQILTLIFLLWALTYFGSKCCDIVWHVLYVQLTILGVCSGCIHLPILHLQDSPSDYFNRKSRIMQAVVDARVHCRAFRRDSLEWFQIPWSPIWLEHHIAVSTVLK